MDDKKMTIALFHQLLQGDQDEDNGLLSVLRSLTNVQDTESLSTKPGPMGTWAAWIQI